MSRNSGNIYLLKRGNCKFTVKTNYAEIDGARLVLIYDTDHENEKGLTLVVRG